MSNDTDKIIVRHAARIILLDRDNRVLLFRCQEPGEERAFWITPGGGLEADESYEQAATRELYEETGLSDVTLGPCVWTRSHTFPWLGKIYRQHERFFVVRIGTHQVDTKSHTDDERRVLTQHRWWSAQAIREAGQETFAPSRLGSLLNDLVGITPTQPIDVGI